MPETCETMYMCKLRQIFILPHEIWVSINITSNTLSIYNKINLYHGIDNSQNIIKFDQVFPTIFEICHDNLTMTEVLTFVHHVDILTKVVYHIPHVDNKKYNTI